MNATAGTPSSPSTGSTTASGFQRQSIESLLDPSQTTQLGKNALHIALFDDNVGLWYPSWVGGYAASLLQRVAVNRMNGVGAFNATVAAAGAATSCGASSAQRVAPPLPVDTLEIVHETAGSADFLQDRMLRNFLAPGQRLISRRSLVNTTLQHVGMNALALAAASAGAASDEFVVDGAAPYLSNTSTAIKWRTLGATTAASAAGMDGFGMPTFVSGSSPTAATAATADTPVMIGVGIVDGQWTHDAGYQGLPGRHFSQATRKHMESLRLAAFSGTWVKVDVLIDWSTHLYTVRLNDVTVARAQPFNGTALTRLGVYVPSAAGAQAAWIDEVYVGDDDGMGFECPVPASEPDRAASMADVTNTARDAVGGAILVPDPAEEPTRDAGNGALRRVQQLPSSDWRVSDVGPPTSFTGMMRHQSHLSRRIVYTHELHGGLLFNDGAPHRWYHSDMPVPIQRMPYAVQPVPPADWWSTAVPTIDPTWSGLGGGGITGFTTGASAPTSVQAGIASSLGLLQGTDGASVATTMAVLPYFYFPTIVSVNQLLDAATAIGPMNGEGSTGALPFSNTIPFPTMSALSYAPGVSSNGYRGPGARSFTNADGSGGQGTSGQCSYLQLTARQYRDLAADALRRAVNIRGNPALSGYDADAAKPFDAAVVQALAEQGVLLAAAAVSPTALSSVAVFNCTDDSFMAASFNDVYGPQPGVVDALSRAIDGLYELNMTTGARTVPGGTISPLHLLHMLDETDFMQTYRGTLPYGVIHNALVTYAGYTGSGFTGAAGIGAHPDGGVAQVAAGAAANSVDPARRGAAYDAQSIAALEAYLGASLPAAAAAPTRPRYDPAFNSHATASQSLTGGPTAGWSLDSTGRRLTPRRRGVLGAAAHARTASVSLGAALYAPKAYLHASSAAALGGGLQQMLLSVHDPVVAAARDLHAAWLAQSAFNGSSTTSLYARSDPESYTSGVDGTSDFFSEHDFAQAWLYGSQEGQVPGLQQGYANGVPASVATSAATADTTRMPGGLQSQRSVSGFDETLPGIAFAAYFSGDDLPANDAMQAAAWCDRALTPLAALPTDYPTFAASGLSSVDFCAAMRLGKQYTTGYLDAATFAANYTSLAASGVYNASTPWPPASAVSAAAGANVTGILQAAEALVGERIGARGRHYWYTEHDNAWFDSWDSSRWWMTGGIGACSSDDMQLWRNEGIMLHFANITGPAANANYTLVAEPEVYQQVPAMNVIAQAAVAAAGTSTSGYLPFGTLWLASLGLSPAAAAATLVAGVQNGATTLCNVSRAKLDTCLTSSWPSFSLSAATCAAGVDLPLASLVATPTLAANVTDSAVGFAAGLLGPLTTAVVGSGGVSSGVWRAERPKVLARTMALPAWVASALQGASGKSTIGGAGLRPTAATTAQTLARAFQSGALPSTSARKIPSHANSRVNGKPYPIARTLYFGSVGTAYTNLTNSARTAVYANARANVASSTRVDARGITDCEATFAMQSTADGMAANDVAVMGAGLVGTGAARVPADPTFGAVHRCRAGVAGVTPTASLPRGNETLPAVDYAANPAANLRPVTVGDMLTDDAASSVHDISLPATLASMAPLGVITNTSAAGFNLSWFAASTPANGSHPFLLADTADVASVSVYVMWMAVSDVYYALLPNASASPNPFGQAASSWWAWGGGDRDGFAPPPPPEAAAPRFRVAGVALSLHPAGPFLFLHALMPDGNSTVDLTLFQQKGPSETHAAAQQAAVAAGKAAQSTWSALNCSSPNANATACAAAAPAIAVASANAVAPLLAKASSGPAFLARTYFATTRYILPAPVMQPIWESVKTTVKRLPGTNRTTALVAGGDVNPLVFTFPGWYNSSDWSLYDAYTAVSDEDSQDFALNYHRTVYAAGYDNPKDIYIQQWRREDRDWLAYSDLWQETWDGGAGVFRLVIRPNFTSEFDTMAGLPPPFHPAMSAYVDPLFTLAAPGQAAVDAVLAGALQVAYAPADRDDVLSAVLDMHAPRQLGMLGRPPISSRYLDPRDPTNSGWRPMSVPSVRAQPYFFNYRDGNVYDNPVHPTVPDLLVAPWHVVELRRTKYVAVSRLSDDYLGCELLVSVVEGASVEGQPLQELLLAQAYAGQPAEFEDVATGGTTAGSDAGGNPFGWTQRLDTPSGYVDPLGHLVLTGGWNANDTTIATSGLQALVGPPGGSQRAPPGTPSEADLQSGWVNETANVVPPTPVYAPPSTFQQDVYGSDAPFYALPSADWRDRHWQFNLSYSDRWFDFRNFRDRQVLPTIPGTELCLDIHDRAMLQYTECVRVLANETVWGDTPAWENYQRVNRSYSRALNTDELERCYRLHAELLDAYEACVATHIPAFDKLQEWSFGNRECVGGGGICGPPLAAVNGSSQATPPYGQLSGVSAADAARTQGLGLPYDTALPPAEPWTVDKAVLSSWSPAVAEAHLAGQPELLQSDGRSARTIAAQAAAHGTTCPPWLIGTPDGPASLAAAPFEAVYASGPNGTAPALVPYIGDLRFNASRYTQLLGINGTAYVNINGTLASLGNGTYAVPESLPPPCVDDQLRSVPCDEQTLEPTIMRAPVEWERDLADEDDIEKGKERMPPLQLGT